MIGAAIESAQTPIVAAKAPEPEAELKPQTKAAAPPDSNTATLKPETTAEPKPDSEPKPKAKTPSDVAPQAVKQVNEPKGVPTAALRPAAPKGSK